MKTEKKTRMTIAKYLSILNVQTAFKKVYANNMAKGDYVCFKNKTLVKTKVLKSWEKIK